MDVRDLMTIKEKEIEFGDGPKTFPVVVLTGSTKFKEEFAIAGRRMSDMGYIVLSIHEFSHTDGEILSDEDIDRLTEMHFQRIRMADTMYVINKNGYIGKGGKKEIAYARKLKRKIIFLEEPVGQMAIDIEYDKINTINSENYYGLHKMNRVNQE